MATNHTANYNLNLWEPTDSFAREEFNENTTKLDAALAAVQSTVDSSISVGTLTVVEGKGTLVDLNLGFHPHLVILFKNRSNCYFLTRTGGYTSTSAGNFVSTSYVSLKENGIKFPISHDSAPDGEEPPPSSYSYIAFR